VLVGAEAVVENGGVINKLGTYQIALAAKAHNVPVYVAAESYKFARWVGGTAPTGAWKALCTLGCTAQGCYMSAVQA